MQTSQSERNLFRQQMAGRNIPNKPQTPTQAKSFEYNNNPFYVVTFETKPFGLTLNPFNEQRQIGAVVMVNHNVNDQLISQGSRFMAINGDNCKNFKFERIKNMCRNANLPTTIKFIHADHTINSQPQQIMTSVSAGGGGPSAILSTNPNAHLTATPANINMYNANAPRASSKSYGSSNNNNNNNRGSGPPSPRATNLKQNKSNSPRFTKTNGVKKSPKLKSIKAKKEEQVEGLIVDQPKEVTVTKPKKKKKSTKPKESLKAKQNREKKSAKQLMESLGGMNDIKKAEKFERDRRWKECVESYEKGIEDLEKSLKTLEIANILSQYQQQQCQQQIDEYCRNLIKIQREHKQEIEAAKRKKSGIFKKTNILCLNHYLLRF